MKKLGGDDVGIDEYEKNIQVAKINEIKKNLMSS